MSSLVLVEHDPVRKPVSTFRDHALFRCLMHFDHVAVRIIEEDLVPAVHRPSAVVGVANAFFVQALLERRDVVGAKRDVAALDRVHHLAGAEADIHVLLGQMKLRGAIGDERHVTRIALVLDALARHRGLGLHVEHLAIELVHRGKVGAAQVDVMQLEFHGTPSDVSQGGQSERLRACPPYRGGHGARRVRLCPPYNTYASLRVTLSNSSSIAKARGMIFCSTAYCITISSGLRSASTPKGKKSIPSLEGGIAALVALSMRKISAITSGRVSASSLSTQNR